MIQCSVHEDALCYTQMQGKVGHLTSKTQARGPIGRDCEGLD